MLWTPNPKTTASIPLCPRCGKLRRDWHRANYKRLGVGWLHGVCCCGGCPPATISITLSGFDANLCGCTNGSGFSYVQNSLSVDGTYVVGFDVTSGGRHIFGIADVQTGAFGNYTQYSSINCMGSTTGDGDMDRLGLVTHLSGDCTEIEIAEWLVYNATDAGIRATLWNIVLPATPVLPNTDVSAGGCGIYTSAVKPGSVASSGTIRIEY